MIIFPAVKKYKELPGEINLQQGISFIHHKDTYPAKIAFKKPLFEVKSGDVILKFQYNQSLTDEAYHILINHEGILLKYKTYRGIFYGIKTIIQIGEQKDWIFPHLEIEDEPELSLRGFLLDISRNKIPRVQTIKTYIDLLAMLNYNHLELYVEGFSYFYPSFKELYRSGMTPMMPNEFKELEKYAFDRMIDLVPCHNGLGHMTAWLKHYPELAVMPDGMFFWGSHREPSTLNPLDSKSLELVKAFYKDALLNSKSAYFNMNLDEPYELGHGKTESEKNRIGVGQMYLDYVVKLVDYVKEYHKTPMIWGDVLNHYPDLLSKLPKELIYVDWGYDHDYPFYKTLKRLSDASVKFVAAPGTSSWNSIMGRTYTMFENIREACLHTKAYQGLGMLLTDWGDNGHLQPFSTSIPAIVYGGMESWRGRMNNRYEIKEFINQYLVNDKKNIAGQLLIDMGTYCEYEDSYVYNATKILKVIQSVKHLDQSDLEGSFHSYMKDHIYGNNDVYHLLIKELKTFEKRASKIEPISKQGKMIKNDMKLAILMMKSWVVLIRMQSESISLKEYRLNHLWIKKEYPKLIQMFEKNWLSRNKSGGLEDSIRILNKLDDVIKSLKDHPSYIHS